MKLARPFTNLFVFSLIAVGIIIGAGAAMAESRINETFTGKAIDGYDPVAYFTQSKPVEGMSEFSHEWNGATWLFASAANQQAFAKDPEKFAPKYGGYCAWAVSEGYTADIDPDAWKIVEGALYLNYSKEVQATWEKDIPGNIVKANKNWPGIQSKLN